MSIEIPYGQSTYRASRESPPNNRLKRTPTSWALPKLVSFWQIKYEPWRDRPAWSAPLSPGTFDGVESMQNFGAVAESTRSWVIAEGAHVNAPADGGALAKAAVRCSGALPRALTRLLESFDGMPEDQWDALPNLIRFFPASEVQPVAEVFPEFYADVHSAIVFADYSLAACFFAISRVPEDGPIYAVGLEAPARVASTLHQFLSEMLADPDSIMEW